MKTGNKGKSIIKSFEKCKLVAYMPTPNDVPTIGYGHTKGVKMGDKITEDQADQCLADDLEWVEHCINKYVEVPLKQNQFDALASLIFNIGCTNFRNSTLLRLLNQGDDCSGQFLRWNKQGNEVLRGLTLRREEERRLFLA